MDYDEDKPIVYYGSNANPFRSDASFVEIGFNGDKPYITSVSSRLHREDVRKTQPNSKIISASDARTGLDLRIEDDDNSTPKIEIFNCEYKTLFERIMEHGIMPFPTKLSEVMNANIERCNEMAEDFGLTKRLDGDASDEDTDRFRRYLLMPRVVMQNIGIVANYDFKACDLCAKVLDLGVMPPENRETEEYRSRIVTVLHMH